MYTNWTRKAKSSCAHIQCVGIIGGEQCAQQKSVSFVKFKLVLRPSVLTWGDCWEAKITHCRKDDLSYISHIHGDLEARSECGCCVASLFCQLYPNIWLWDFIDTTNSDHPSINHLEYITSLLISKVDYFSKYSCFFLSIPFCTGTVHALSWSSNSICTQSIFIFKLTI